MPDPSSPSSSETVVLKFLEGTLFAVPNAGHVRAPQGTAIEFTSTDFSFTVEFTQLTGDPAPIPAEPSCGGGPYSATVTLPAVPPGATAPSYKYTVKGGGKAAGKVLDPIVIVDKK